MTSAFRLFFRLDKVGRIPYIGNTGFTHTAPKFQRKYLLISSVGQDHFKNTKTKAALGSRGLPLSVSGSHRHFSSVTLKDVKKSDEERGAPKKKPKTIESPKIKLISESQALSVVTLEEAEKIASKKGLHLIPAGFKKESSTEKPTYRLVTNAEFLKAEKPSTESDFSNERDTEKDEKKKVKDVKTLLLKSKIAEHDALSKISSIKKWIEKGHTVRVMIGQTTDKGDSESIYKLMEKNLKDTGVRFLQKVVKGDQIRVQLMPPKESQSQQAKGSKTAAEHQGESTGVGL